MDVGHSWAQIDYALPEGGTQRRVYSFAPVASPQINPLVEVPGMVETVYPLYGGERFIGFAMSSEQTAAVLAAAEQVVAEPPLYHGANSNCTDFTIKLASVAGFPVSTEGIDTPNSIVEAANNKVPRNGIYDPNNPDAWVLP